MGISYNGDRSDVDDSSATGTVLTIGTTAVELKVDVVRNPNRQTLMVYNDSLVNVFLGPSTVTTTGATKGIPLVPRQFISLPIGNVPYFAISTIAGTGLIVQELA